MGSRNHYAKRSRGWGAIGQSNPNFRQTPRLSTFPRYPAHHCLCLRFNLHLTMNAARLEVRMESLLLSCRALSSPTTCRFIPALGCPLSTFKQAVNKSYRDRNPHNQSSSNSILDAKSRSKVDSHFWIHCFPIDGSFILYPSRIRYISSCSRDSALIR